MLCDISEKLKELREENGMSQEQMAKELNFTKSLIWSYELGKKEPTISHVVRIADYFKVSVDYLLDREEKVSSIELPRQAKDFTFTIDNTELTEDELSGAVTFVKVKREMNT